MHGVVALLGTMFGQHSNGTTCTLCFLLPVPLGESGREQ
jgi:hypothetical protein